MSSDNKMSDIIRSSLEGVRSFTDVDTVVGKAITTPSGVTVIPVSKISVGFAGGGLDFGQKRLNSSQSFGTGSGSGVSITPVAFLTVDKNAEINLIHVTDKSSPGVDRLVSLIEGAPDIIEKIKNTFS